MKRCLVFSLTMIFVLGCALPFKSIDSSSQYKVDQIVKKGHTTVRYPAALKVSSDGIKYKNIIMRKYKPVPWKAISIIRNRYKGPGKAGTVSEKYHYHQIRFYIDDKELSPDPYWLEFEVCCDKEIGDKFVKKIRRYR